MKICPTSHPPPTSSGADLSVLQKIRTAYEIWHKKLPDIPKLDRYSLGQKIDVLFTDVIELILSAGFASRPNKTLFIQKASVKLDTLKFFLELAWSLGLFDEKILATISNPLFEAGNMLGGWQRQLAKETPLN